MHHGIERVSSNGPVPSARLLACVRSGAAPEQPGAVMGHPTAAAFNAKIGDLETPCLLVDEFKMMANIHRLQSHLNGLGAKLRPHLKTGKSVEIARRLMASPQGPCAVSTLKEAEQFAAAGVKDILYAVGITPRKLERVLALRRAGVDLAIVLDSLAQAVAVGEFSRAHHHPLPTFIEVDTDGHRGGISPNDPSNLIAVGRALVEGGAILRGVMAHAGESYNVATPTELIAMAELERRGAVAAAEHLRQAGLPCPSVSVGSTPTAHFARDLTGVTEVRAGVFVFFDLVMAGIGVCEIDDIALSVLASVIGHQRDRGWILIDAGWTALSRDRGTAGQKVDQGYGLVCDVAGQPYRDLIVHQVSQEHGVIAVRPGSDAVLPDMAIGTVVRILPNHACATASQHDRYFVSEGGGKDAHAVWPRFSGW